MHDNTKIENISITLTSVITTRKVMMTLITKATVVMTIMITKIRITVTVTEKNNSNYNDNNTATQVTIKTETISNRKH